MQGRHLIWEGRRVCMGGGGGWENLTRNTCSFPVQPRETFVILLGGTQIAAGAGGWEILLQEDNSSVRRTKG